MNPIRAMSGARGATVAGLVLAAVGMLIQMGAGSDLFPTITGPVVLLLTAAGVAFLRGRWTAYAGLAVPLVLAIGLIVSTVMSPAFVEQIASAANAAIVVGSLAHVVGLVMAVAGGCWLIATRSGEAIGAGVEEPEVT